MFKLEGCTTWLRVYIVSALKGRRSCTKCDDSDLVRKRFELFHADVARHCNSCIIICLSTSIVHRGNWTARTASGRLRKCTTMPEVPLWSWLVRRPMVNIQMNLHSFLWERVRSNNTDFQRVQILIYTPTYENGVPTDWRSRLHVSIAQTRSATVEQWDRASKSLLKSLR